MLVGESIVQWDERWANALGKKDLTQAVELSQKSGDDVVTPATPPMLEEKKVLKTECPEQDLNLHALASTSS